VPSDRMTAVLALLGGASSTERDADLLPVRERSSWLRGSGRRNRIRGCLQNQELASIARVQIRFSGSFAWISSGSLS
jgi:hypothetical protein